jgi:FKBP-type peptidyl-prolyl cis-trans isomerase
MRVSLFVLLIFYIVGCTHKTITKSSGLKYQILEKGKGAKVVAGNHVYIFETTSYRNGTVLYSNYTAKNPVKILIGGNQATEAVDQGIRGMRAGEVRELYAPHYLVKRTGYPPNVSPDSSLVIKIRLEKIEN